MVAFCIKLQHIYAAHITYLILEQTSGVSSSPFLKGTNYLREVLSVIDIRQHLIVT